MFIDIDDLRKYAIGVEASLSLEDLSSSIAKAKNIIYQIITKEIFNTMSEDENLKLAVANYAMYSYLIFWNISKNNTDQKLYKYQYEALREEYITSFWCAMDEILISLDSASSKEWQATEMYKKRQNQLIKTAADFDNYFQIDKSSYFFYKIQFLLSKITEDEITPRIKNLTGEIRTKLDAKIKRVLAYHTMAEAIMYFDLSELPKSIRNDISHEFTKEGSLLQTREKLRATLINSVNSYYKQLEQEIQAQSSGLSSQQNFNQENNNFYFMN